MNQRVTQEELNAAWSALNSIPSRLAELRREMVQLEQRRDEALEVVNRARREAESDES